MKRAQLKIFVCFRPTLPAVLYVLLFLLVSSLAYGLPQQAAALSTVTDQHGAPLSDTFFAQNPIGLKSNGDVFFGIAGKDLSFREAATGNKTRMLQVNDPMPGFPGSVLTLAAAAAQMNSAGHMAMINTWASKGSKNPAGVFVYDGSEYKKVALTGEAVPDVTDGVFTNFRQLRVNSNDMVAFVAEYDPVGPSMLGVFLGSPTSAPVKIATAEDLDPLIEGPDNIYLIGVDDAGNVAFLCEEFANPFGYSIVVGSPTGVLSIIRSNDLAPGTVGNFNLPATVGNYSFNAAGDLAFYSNVFNDPSVYRGIWIRHITSAIEKLIVNGESTGTGLGGTYNAITFRGFNDSGQVLYSSNLGGSATTNQALFIKTLSTNAQVVCYRNQTFSDAQQIDTVGSTTLSPAGKVVVVTTLKNPYGRVLMLSDPSTSPEVIALEGTATPDGGAYSYITAFIVNGNHQVAFRSDMVPIEAIGLFLWTSGSPVQSIMNTGQTVPGGANAALSTNDMAVSDDEVVFRSFSGEGKETLFAKSLHPADKTIRRIVGDGDPAPGGGILAFIQRPAINNKEEIAFITEIIGGTPYPGGAIWLSKPGSELDNLVTRGDPAPGSAGGSFSGFSGALRINDQSEVAFWAPVSGSSGNSSPHGVFLVSSSGTVQSVARVGDASPAGGTFSNINNAIYLSNLGTVAFRATSQVSPNQYVDGYFVGSATGAPVKIMAVGDAWGAGSFSRIAFNFRMNSAGQVVFWANLQFEEEGIFIATPGGAPERIVSADDESLTPGSMISLTFLDAFFDVNSSGQVAFWGVYLVSPPPSFSYNVGYFVGSAGTVPELILSAGQPIPGGELCAAFVPKINGFALADTGELAIYVPGTMGNPDLPRYIIAAADGTLRRFAAVGDKAAGTDSEFGRLGSVLSNSTGKFIIDATLVEGSARQGIFKSGGMQAPHDVDRDGVTDIAVYRPDEGYWYTLLSHAPGSYDSRQWGAPGDLATPGDYDGDGKGDLAVWRPISGVWYIIPSSDPDTYECIQWGIPTDIPVPGDYDGDGKDDIAVWRPETGSWYIIPSTDPETFTSIQWGMANDVPVPADFDADGMTDISVWRPVDGTWYILPSNSTGSYSAIQWGIASDKPVPADYDADGMADIAVWRPDGGIWYILPSATPDAYTSTAWGLSTDIPVGTDYNGDGKADIGVFRPEDGTWCLLSDSALGTYTSIQWGLGTDAPISGFTTIDYSY